MVHMTAHAFETPPPKIERLNLRLTAEERSLIEDAAEAEGFTVSEFMLAAARERAHRVLLLPRAFVVDDATFDEMMRDEEPAPVSPEMKRRLRRARTVKVTPA